jgi:hypothetical protein
MIVLFYLLHKRLSNSELPYSIANNIQTNGNNFKSCDNKTKSSYNSNQLLSTTASNQWTRINYIDNNIESSDNNNKLSDNKNQL